MERDCPPIFLQVDVDGLWAVRECYGREENGTFENDPVWSEGVPVLSRLFLEMGIPAGFFIVGRDLELESKRDAAAALWREGFEAGNHSWSHTIGLTGTAAGNMLEEIRRTDAALRETGADPAGFRSPGYDVDARLLHAVRRAGYLYDASVLPTRLAPVLRLAGQWIARRRLENDRQFGRVSYGRAPRRPYFPRVHAIRKPARTFDEARLLEIPVGTTPVLRLPLTASALLPMSRVRLGSLFERLSARRHPVLLLLHGIDGVDCRQRIVMDTHRPRAGGFSLSSKQKRAALRRILTEALRYFQPQLAADYARERCR